jgi:DNA-binding winged helix-turn-helix (wHTH) protein
MRFRAEDFEFDPGTGEVHRGGSINRLEPQPAALLELLMSRPGGLVTRQEAIRALWGDQTSVSFQDGLDYSVRQIRIALNDQVRQPRYLETIPRRGYRFVATVDVLSAPADRSRSLPGRTVRRWMAAALCGVLLAAATVVIERRPNRHHEIAVTILRSIHDRLF